MTSNMKADAEDPSRSARRDLATTVKVVGDRAIYEVRSSSGLYRDRLLHIGFRQESDGTFTRNLSARGDVQAIHDRFSLHLEDMLLQSARLRPVLWQDALALFLQRVQGAGLRWFLYGSGALAARGLDVDPGDLDFWVDDAEKAGELFEDLLIEPVTIMKGWVANSGGRAFSGCILEWLSEVNPDVDQPSLHEHGPRAMERLEQIVWGGWEVPVAPLDLQLLVAERRGRIETANKIRDHLSAMRNATAMSYDWREP